MTPPRLAVDHILFVRDDTADILEPDVVLPYRLVERQSD